MFLDKRNLLHFEKPKIYFLSICILFAFDGWASKDSLIAFSNPRAVIKNHLENLQNDHFFPENAAKSFRFSPKIDPKTKNLLAIQLKQIWDAQGFFVNLQSIPDSANSFSPYFPDSNNRAVYLDKIDGIWRYSLSTSHSISKLYDKEFPKRFALFEKLLPRHLSKRIGGLYEWQWIGILLAIGISSLTFFMIRWLVRDSLIWVLLRLRFESAARLLVKPVSTPIGFLLCLLFARFMIKSLHLPIGYSSFFKFAFAALIPLLFVSIAYRFVSLLTVYLKKLSSKTESKLDDQLVPMVDKFLKFFVIAVGLVFVLQNLGYSVTGLLAGLSLGGLALAFAAQDTLKHFFGSIMIFIDKPFQIGDWISGGDIDGTVEEVGFRSTRIRTFRDSIQYVPNGIVADLIIDNHGERNYRRFRTNIGITYGTSTQKIEEFVEGLKAIIMAHPKTVKNNFHVQLNNFGASSLDILFYVFFAVEDWDQELSVRHDIMLKIINLSEKVGVEFAFPSQSLYLENFSEQTIKKD